MMKQKLILLLGVIGLALDRFLHSEPLVDLANSDGGLAQDTGRTTLFAESALSARYLLVKKGTADNEIAACGATDRPIGVCEDSPGADDPAGVHLFGCGGGTMTVTASKAVEVGDECFTTAGGKVTDTAVNNCYSVGVAMTAAAGDGDTFQLMPILKLDAESV